MPPKKPTPQNKDDVIFARLTALEEAVKILETSKVPTLPFYDSGNFPLAAQEGQIVLAGPVAPSVDTGTLILCLGYRDPDQFYQSVYTIDSLTGVAREIFAGDTNSGSGYPDWSHAKWSRDRSLVYLSVINSGTYELWQVAPDASSWSMVGSIAGLTSITGQRKAFKETPSDGLKLAYGSTGSPSVLQIYDIPAGTHTDVFDTSSLPFPFTNNIITAMQWNADATKLSIWVSSTPFTINADGTGVEQLVGTTDISSEYLAWDPSGSGLIAYANASQGPAVVNFDGTGQLDLDSITLRSYVEWNPTGTKLAYVDIDDDLIKVINPDGTGKVSIANSDISPGTYVQAATFRLTWSPDGSQIARIVYSSGDPIIVKILDPVGLDMITSFTLTDAPSYASFLQWYTLHDEGDG